MFTRLNASTEAYNALKESTFVSINTTLALPLQMITSQKKSFILYHSSTILQLSIQGLPVFGALGWRVGFRNSELEVCSIYSNTLNTNLFYTQ